MNLYEFKQWLSGVNYLQITELNDVLATNPTGIVPENTFPRYAELFAVYITQASDQFDVVDNLIDSIDRSFWNGHMLPIANYCIDICNTYTFDLFAIKDITYDDSIVYTTEPKYFLVDVNGADDHFHIPIVTPLGGTRKLIFYTKTEPVQGGFKVTSLRSICEYCVFDETAMPSLSAMAKDADGNNIRATTIGLSFVKIGTSADRSADMKELINIIDNNFDFQNVHEVFDVDSYGKIINAKRNPMNYELFVGNTFMPLDSLPELIMKEHNRLTQDSEPAGPIDRISISNQLLNSIALTDYSNHDGTEVYFKPSCIKHMEIDNGAVTSVGGKYAVGQRIYLYAKNTGFVFPATITRIDASEAHGFLEADVDSYNSKWFKLEDSSLLEDYFKTDIECEVIDDNISNFMDEFNNSKYESYNIIPLSTGFDTPDDVYKMPGDPIFVVNNAPFVYTRLNYFFDELVPNRFIDIDSEEHKMYHMRYIGYDKLCSDNQIISINMISHNFSEFTNPEIYPILRTEPNDHEIWDEELRVFNIYEHGGYVEQDDAQRFIVGAEESCERNREVAQIAWEKIEEGGLIDAEYTNWLMTYENAILKVEHYSEFINKLEYMKKQDEKPTTWYNVPLYEATEVYVSNGKAKPISSYIPNIGYLTFTDKIDVFVYDWEHKKWIDPSMYSTSVTIVNGVKVNQPDNYNTNDVQYKLDIIFDRTIEESAKMIIYFGYKYSDIYDDIPINDKTCYVRFKPIISTSKFNDDNNIYTSMRIRKHFDGTETYLFDELSSGENISIDRYYTCIRPKRNGKYMYVPVLRMCDLTATQQDTDFDYTHFDLYIPNPFKDTTTQRGFNRQTFNVVIAQEIDNFFENEKIRLICVSNGNDRWYDGNVSSVMFEGYTSKSGGNQVITITKSTLNNFESGTYICTVFDAPEYGCVGGLVVITVTANPQTITDGDWVKVPADMYAYHDLPEKFLLVPNDASINPSHPVTFTFKNSYLKYSDDTDPTPFEYYYDSQNNVKLPMSNVRNNAHDERLVVDTSVDTDVKLIKSTYIGITRYALQAIPENGFIDVTGYIPTPLSRKRYEFYVNGRNVTDTENLIILSPTTLQLVNLRSLKNFELIELVDDVHASYLFKEGPVYVAVNGDAYTSYRQMMLANFDITRQDIKYLFNVYLHDTIHDYRKGFIDDPKNVDQERDILDGITSPPVTAYNQCYNLPSINGVQLMHLSNKDIGLVEIPSEKILDKFDKTWKKEILTNPHFQYTHLIDNREQYIRLHSKDVGDMFPDIPDPENWMVVYITGNTTKYFTLYISNTEDGAIDNTNDTLKIIPFVKSGMYVLVNKSYAGKYLHATYHNANVITL